MKFKKLKIILIVFLFLLGFNFLNATGSVDQGQNGTGSIDQSSSPTSLTNPLGARTPEVLIGDAINTIFSLVGSLALLMFIYGGFTWMTSAGNKEAVDKGKNIIKWAAIGLVIIFSSYALVRFLIVGVGAA